MENGNTYDRFVRCASQKSIRNSHFNAVFAPILKTNPDYRCGDDKRIEVYRALRLAEIDPYPKVIMKAPNLIDDFYLNILDCSSANTMAIALSDKIIMWNLVSKTRETLTARTFFPGQNLHGEYISALRFANAEETIIVGNSAGRIAVTDILTNTSHIYTSQNSGRIVSISPTKQGFVTGTRSGIIFLYDTRVLRPTQVLSGAHRLEVCGLQMSPDNNFLASGGNDNQVFIWDMRLNRLPLHHQSDHLAAVKALAWCPWQSNVLVTGSGTADKRIRVWDTTNNTCLSSVYTDDQISSVHFAVDRSELVSCHGFLGNSINVWRYPEMFLITSIHAHNSRILQSCISKDASVLITAAADEYIKVWNIFPQR